MFKIRQDLYLTSKKNGWKRERFREERERDGRRKKKEASENLYKRKKQISAERDKESEGLACKIWKKAKKGKMVDRRRQRKVMRSKG